VKHLLLAILLTSCTHDLATCHAEHEADALRAARVEANMTAWEPWSREMRRRCGR